MFLINLKIINGPCEKILMSSKRQKHHYTVPVNNAYKSRVKVFF